MNPLNHKIALFAGWKRIDTGFGEMWEPQGKLLEPPDYMNSLDAMYEIETIIDKDDILWDRYVELLPAKEPLRNTALLRAYAVSTLIDLWICPKCGSSEVQKYHHLSTFALPECYYQSCYDCDHQWNHA